MADFSDNKIFYSYVTTHRPLFAKVTLEKLNPQGRGRRRNVGFYENLRIFYDFFID
jgi:hypothetical protein